MKTRTKILIALSIPFFCFFAFGETAFGQHVLQGNMAAETDHRKADDMIIGAALAPIVYGAIPFVLLAVSGLTSLVLEIRESRK